MSENVNELEGNEQNFAKSCLEMNTLKELSESHTPEEADESDMKNWDISAQEWSDAIEAARLDMIADEEDE
ncbi:MAG: hypothetical protein KAJ03_01195 [Gammaproteobacteria bacterium]|nr:hypothetical protein [Gammaproteobacteria bacterium]